MKKCVIILSKGGKTPPNKSNYERMKAMLGDRLRAIRTEHKLTQQSVADILGVDRTTYTVYEIGSSYPSLESLYKLSQIYNVTVDYLIGAEERRNANVKVSDNSGSVAVASNADPIAYLGKDEKTLIMCYRILDENAQKELTKYIKEFTKEHCQGLI